jgi:predicted phosphodiesterase|nr:MAG TPA: DNA polymerase II small subunit [Caudoviricetes sp.]
MTLLSKAQIATQELEDRVISYQDWAEKVLGLDYRDVFADEYIRRGAKVFSIFLKHLEDVGDVEAEDEMQDMLEQLKAERIKIQTANLEYNAIQRAEARNDLFNEQIIKAIERLEPIKGARPKLDVEPCDKHRTALLAISDLHAGSTFTVKGIYNEIVNEYSYDIMCARLWSIIDKIEADDIVFDDLTAAICGDLVEGILRESSLTKLREPVTDTVIRLAEFLSEWIYQLSIRLEKKVNVVIIGGNHDTVRSLTSRPMFEGENLTKIVVEFIKLRLQDLDWITVDDYQDVAIKNIQGVNVMFQHGEDKDLRTTMDYFSNLYNIDVDEIVAGHLHRTESKTVGITELGDRQLTRVGSIVGTDSYAKQIRASARPSCYMALYEEDNGKTWSRNYYL